MCFDSSAGCGNEMRQKRSVISIPAKASFLRVKLPLSLGLAAVLTPVFSDWVKANATFVGSMFDSENYDALLELEATYRSTSRRPSCLMCAKTSSLKCLPREMLPGKEQNCAVPSLVARCLTILCG